ncbi:unnamed protein product [Rotaria socialis]|uniref:ubiquitinyl hydrolase 1 n=2 Tax=Rotaria socialis TaxID=392032 RepID=A0A818BPP4_9BILA|nr:unnamed protein product [Rotaria socialis]CAF3624099.1 unnamed protein product [Rotaria socialis]
MTIPKYVELELNNGSIYKMIPEQVGYKDKNGIWMTRTQLPLSLGYAITVYRSQCMTYNKLVVDLTDINWKPGMFYTILSRTRKLTDIVILAYERKSFKVSKAALLEMARLHKLEEEFPIQIEQYLQSENYTDWCLSQSLNIPKLSPIPSYKNIIICEEQDRNYCGRHSLRALAQNLDLFSDEYLVEIANNLAAAEQICRNGDSIRITQYYYENSGDYDIQVLDAALRHIFNIQLLQINKLENSNCPIRSLILSNTQNIQALLIQQDYHYYILRQFRLTKGYFFKIDSKHTMYHEPIHCQDILKFIDLLLQYLLEPRTLCDEEYALFKTFGYNQSKPDIVNNFDQFLENFTSQYDYHTWSNYIDWNLFIIAGGSVVLSLLARPLFQNTSEIDLFFLKESEHLFKISVARFKLVQFDLYRKFTINDIFHDKNFAPSLIIQLIRPTTTSTNISRIIHSFDLDICAAAFNSKKVIISFACLQALNSDFTTCYAVPFSTSKFTRRAPRLYKYQQRGFNILIPQQFDINKFLATPVEDCKEARPEQIYRFRRTHFGDNCDSFSIQKKFCEYYNLI